MTARGLIVSDFADCFAPALRQIGEWVRSGKVKYREDIVDVIDKAPLAFIGMLRGENLGKMLVEVGGTGGGSFERLRDRAAQLSSVNLSAAEPE